jgi:hypothetical protein
VRPQPVDDFEEFAGVTETAEAAQEAVPAGK